MSVYIMGRIISTATVVAILALGAPSALFAAGPMAARRQDPPTGTVRGTTKDAAGANLAQTKVRVRNSQTGAIAAELLTDSNGTFIGVVPAGSYIVEVVGANGTIIGLSPVITVAAGSTATVGVSATAAGAIAGAGAAASHGGLSIFGLGTAMSLVVIGGATTATIFGIKATMNDASGSK